jgi:hypothetical protein
MGSVGERACRAITLLQLVMLNADYLLVNTVSLAAVVPAATLCRPMCVGVWVGVVVVGCVACVCGGGGGFTVFRIRSGASKTGNVRRP